MLVGWVLVSYLHRVAHVGVSVCARFVLRSDVFWCYVGIRLHVMCCGSDVCWFYVRSDDMLVHLGSGGVLMWSGRWWCVQVFRDDDMCF